MDPRSSPSPISFLLPKNRLALIAAVFSLVCVVSPMNKLLFLDTDTNVEIGVWREDIIINFKHNVPGFIIMAFADAKRE